MSCLHKLLKKINILFGEVQDYFFNTKFQLEVWHMIHILYQQIYQFMNEKIDNFVDKYLTTNQTILPKDIHSAQIHQHKWTWKKR
jgi:hypothetical protein